MAAPLARIVAAAGAALLMTSVAQARAQAQAQPFPHRSHLESGFRSEPGNRNCTTKCHTFDGKGMEAYLAPYAGCAACHQPATVERAGVRIEGAEGKLARASAGPGFLHPSAAHAAIACLECHAVVESGATGLDFEVPHDLALCRRCHSDHDDGNPKNQSLRDQLTKPGPNACVICHLTGASDAARPRNDRQFLHRDHLSHDGASTAGWTKDVCNACHQKVVGAPSIRPDNYAALFLGPNDAGASCGRCHRDHPLRVDASGKLDVDAAVAGLTWEPKRRTEVLTTFSHAKHVAVERLKQCTTCHPPSPIGEPQTDATYVTCVACHTDQQVENHPTGVCMRCHQNASPNSDATAAIATVKARREDPAGFVLKSHAHPGVTTAGAALADEKCSDCHLGRPAALLRPRPRPFDHSSHLAGAPTSADCLHCHKNVVATADNAFVRCYDEPPPGEAQSCDACHKGSEFTTQRAVVERTVPRFSHRPHLASKKRSLQCADCHKSDPARASSLLVPGPDSCKECHGHVDPAKVEVTGGKATEQLRGRCGFCHAPDAKDHAPGAANEFSDFKFDVTRSSGRLETGHQWHDRTGGCVSCHGLGQLGPVVAKLAALVVRSPHDDPAPPLKPLHDEWFNKRDCERCHTAEQIAKHRREFGGGR